VAARNGHLPVVVSLLENRADIHCETKVRALKAISLSCRKSVTHLGWLDGYFSGLLCWPSGDCRAPAAGRCLS